MQPTEKRGASSGKTGASCERTIAYSDADEQAWWCYCAHVLQIWLSRKVPWGPGNMTQHPAGLVPDGVNFCSSCGCTPSRAGHGLVECFGQCKASAVGALHGGKVGQQAIITHACHGLDVGTRRTDHVLTKGHGLLRQTLMNGCRRYVHRRVQWRDLGRPWGPRRSGLTPGPNGHEGQKEVARNRGRAFDTAGATGRGFDVVGSKAICYQGDHTVCTGRPRSLLGRVFRRVGQPILTPPGDCYVLPCKQLFS